MNTKEPEQSIFEELFKKQNLKLPNPLCQKRSKTDIGISQKYLVAILINVELPEKTPSIHSTTKSVTISDHQHGDNTQSGFRVGFFVVQCQKIFDIKHFQVVTHEELNFILFCITHTHQKFNVQQGPFLETLTKTEPRPNLVQD